MKASIASVGRWLVFLAAALLLNFPLLSTLITSLKSDAEIVSNASLWVERPTLANYSHVFAMADRFDFMRFIENSLIEASSRRRLFHRIGAARGLRHRSLPSRRELASADDRQSPRDPADRLLHTDLFDVPAGAFARHAVAVNSRAVQKAQRRGPARAEHLPAEGDHLSPVHVVLDGQALHLVKDVHSTFLAAPGIQADLARAMVAGPAQQHRQPRAGVVNQVQAAAHARAGLPRRARRDRGERDAADPELAEHRVQPARLSKITEPERHMAESRDPCQHMLPARRSQPGIQPDLDVHVIKGRPRPGHHRQAGPPGAKVIGQQPLQLVLGPALPPPPGAATAAPAGTRRRVLAQPALQPQPRLRQAFRQVPRPSWQQPT